MRKNVAVFSHDANLAIDPPTYYVTRTEAELRIGRRYAVWLGPKSIQTTRPPGWSPDEAQLVGGGTIKEAWKPRFSDHFIVLQMEKTNAPQNE